MTDVDELINRAFANVVEALSDEYTAVIEEVGAFPEEPEADIVLSSRLRDSMEIDTSNNYAEWSWNPIDPKTRYEYAAKVYHGFRAYGRGRWVPGRHWPEKAIKRVDPARVLAAELNMLGVDASFTSAVDQLID
jgi:hypothetical protein